MVKLGGWGGMMKRLILAASAGALVLAVAAPATGERAAAQAPGAAAAPARAASPDDGSDSRELPLAGTVVHADWDAKPSGDDLANLYPPLAQILQLSGFASIRCDVTTSGTLEACRVVTEAPTGVGFGYATLLASVDFHMKPETLDGKPVRSSVTIPLNWRLPPSALTTHTAFEALPRPAPSPHALALARQIVIAKSSDQRERAEITDYVQKAITGSERNGAPAPSPDQQQDALKLIDAGLDAAVQQWREAAARRLATAVSQPDLEAAARFSASPAGRALAAEEQKTALSSQKDGVALFQLTMANARASFCRREACLPGSGSARADPGSAPAATASR